MGMAVDCRDLEPWGTTRKMSRVKIVRFLVALLVDMLASVFAGTVPVDAVDGVADVFSFAAEVSAVGFVS